MGFLQSCASPFIILPTITTFLLAFFIVHKLKQTKAAKAVQDEQLRRFSSLQVLASGISSAADLKVLGGQALDGILRALGIQEGFALLLVPRTLDSEFCVMHGFTEPAVTEIDRGPMRQYLASSAERWGSLMTFPDLHKPNLDSDWPA